MAVDYNTVSEKLFKVLKGHGYSVQMFDNNEGKEIIDPQQARFFYIKNPNIMVNLDQDNAEIKMHKGPTSVENIEKSIQSVRNLARDNKDFKRSDEIRDLLNDKGILIEDKENITTWKYK